MLNLNDFSFLSEILNLESALSVPSFEFAVFYYYYLMKTGRIHCQTNIQLWLELDDHDFQHHCNYYSCFQTPQKSLPESECKKIYIYTST